MDVVLLIVCMLLVLQWVDTVHFCLSIYAQIINSDYTLQISDTNGRTKEGKATLKYLFRT